MNSHQMGYHYLLLLFIVLSVRIGCDGVLGSKLELDQCGVCGGNGLSCHAVSGIFTRRNLPYGYSLVANIPKGACNINITEMYSSRNYLALRYTDGAYIINGNWRLVHSKAYDAAATTFHYKRPSASDHLSAREYIIAKGPTSQSLDIMILRQEVNQGVIYTYTIPTKKSDSSQSSVSSTANVQGISSDQASTVQHYENFKPELRAQYQGNENQNNQYLQQSSERITSSSTRTQSHSQITSSNPGYSYVINPYRNQTAYNEDARHRLRHHRNRHSRSHKHNRLIVQSAPERRYDYQAFSGTPASYTVATYTGQGANTFRRTHNKPHIISALTPEGQRRYQYAHQQNQGGIYNQENPNIHATIPRTQLAGQQTYGQTLRGQFNYNNPNVRVQIPNDGSQYYSSVNHDAYYTDPITLGRGSLNDQISLSLPDSHSRQIGNLDTGNDYSWRISGFTDCSQTCGGGTQTTVIVCVKGGSQAVVTDENCDNALKPDLQTIACNNSPCPPAWEVGNWTRCSTSCDRGTKTREISCKQRVSNRLILDISDNLCRKLQRPKTVAICNDNKPCIRWKIGNWTQCTAACGRGQRTREVTCVTVDDKPIAENKCQGPKPVDTEICDMGSCAKTWFYTRWSEKCSSDCGEGFHKRELYCNANVDQCNRIQKPHHQKQCTNQLPCGGKWFTGAWGKCSANCGIGYIKRDIVCMKKSGRVFIVVGDENCMAEDKPNVRKKCQREPCRPQWYMSDWTECTKSCQTGIRTREIKCMDENQVASTLCTLEEKPETRQTCNTMPCPTHLPEISGCEDKFKNCRLVVQARLCSYAYYKSICCLSCSGYEEH